MAFQSPTRPWVELQAKASTKHPFQLNLKLVMQNRRNSRAHQLLKITHEAKAGSTKPSPESVTVEKDQKVAENSSGSEPKATGEWGDIYDDISDDDDEASDDDDEDDGFDDAARPGQTATQYGWL
ncbi:uncharacterized protein RHO25_004751 [Cercospora beticola]|uniref:Uncharacterized protein n=1 Tax=Cercospora beticola TaxID=122368 RepID=A0ABZ0NKP6_CERBT|nr:hypothetical protein RHO25_004751 [Cercospora beticola]